MKIALLHYGFVDYTVELANGLASQVDLTVIHPDKVGSIADSALDPRIKVHNFQKPRARYPQNILAVRRLLGFIRELRPDVLHVQATGDPWFDAALLSPGLPPLVTTIHDVFPHPGDKASFHVPGSKYTSRIPFRRSQQLIVHTHQQQRDVIEKLGVDARRVNVVGLGNYGAVYRHWAGDKVPPREPYTLLFFGRIWPYKGLACLLEAMPLIAEKVPEVKLIIAGRGENLAHYFPNGIDERRYEIYGRFIPEAEAAGFFQRSAINVLPYIEASQSGVAAVSYGLGTPVVASRIGGLSELVRDGEDGLLVPPGDARALADAVIRLLLDKPLQEQMRKAMHQRCQNDLNWSNIATATVGVYRKAMELR